MVLGRSWDRHGIRTDVYRADPDRLIVPVVASIHGDGVADCPHCQEMNVSQSSTQSTAVPDPSTLPEAQARFEHFHVGEIECYALSDGAMVRPPPQAGTPTANAPAPVMIPLSCMLARVPGSGLVLLDTGFGADAMTGGQPMRSVGRLSASLAAAGFAPEDIDVVLISHMHPDHIGGMYRSDGTKTYPNATYYVGAEELAFWSQEPLDLSQAASPPHIKKGMEQAVRRMLGFADDTLRTFKAGEEVLPGVGTILLPGHAPGQVGFILSSGGDRLLFTADAIAHPVISIETPDVVNPMDMDPVRAVRTRHELIALLSEPGWQSFTPHFPWPSRGRVHDENGKAAWTPASRG